MSEQTKIQWTDHTFNGWEGCTKVSPGCANCYAEARDRRQMIEKVIHWGKGAPRRRTSAANWRKPLLWDSRAEGSDGFWECRLCGKRQFGWPADPGCELVAARPRVFCSSLSDWLDDEVPIEWLADLLDLIRRTPNLDWQLLTKRPENWQDRLDVALGFCVQQKDQYQPIRGWIREWYIHGNPPHNVWIGTSVEDQARADQRIPKLLEIPARVRFLSCEPLLGPIILGHQEGAYDDKGTPEWLIPGIDWVIVGGESGPGARPFNLAWARSLKNQCSAAGVAFFMKQMGTRPEETVIQDRMVKQLRFKDPKAGDMNEWPEDLRIREFPKS